MSSMGPGPYDLVTQAGDQVPLPSSLPLHVKPGATVPFYCSVYWLGVPTTPTTTSFTLIDPEGNVTTGTVLVNGPGQLESDNLIPTTAITGVWTARWETSGSAYEGALVETSFYVDSLSGSTAVPALWPC